MSITVEQIQEAVDRLLPRTLDVARDEDSGVLDQGKVVARAIQIVRTSLLFDPEASIYALSVAVQAWNEDLQSLLSNLDKLISSDLLLTLVDEAPHYIDDLTGLQRARTSLAQLSGAVAVTGNLSSDYLDDFTTEVEGFVTEHVAPNVQNRNRVVIREEMKALFSTIDSQWSAMLESKSSLVQRVQDFADKDIKAATSEDAIRAATAKLDQILTQLSGSNASEQAELSEQLLIDLAAARAVLSIINTASSPEGLTVVGPASDGRTPSDYLQRSGLAFPEPPLVVTLPSGEKFGDAGRIHMSDKILAAGYAAAVDDGDGDNITDTMRDTTKDFTALGIAVNSFVACAATGLNHRVLEVAPDGVVTDLRITPKMPVTLGDDNRYVILQDVLGTYFKDEGESFWTQYTGGGSGSNVVVSGAGGVFKPDYRLFDDGSGSNSAANYKQENISGEWWPYKHLDPYAQPGGMTAPITNTAGIGSVGTSTLVHNQTTSTGVLGHVLNRLTDSSVSDFTTLGLQVGQLLIVSGVGLLNTFWRIDSINPGYLQLDTLSKSLSASFTAKNWQVRETSDRYVIKLPGAFFDSTLVGAGDLVGVRSDDHSISGVNFTIGHVIAREFIYVGDTGLTSEDDEAVIMCWPAGTPTATIGPDYLKVDESVYQNLVEVGDIARIAGGGAIEGDYTIAEIVAPQVVRLEEIYSEYSAFAPVYLHDPDFRNLFEDDNASFLTKGVEAGDKLYCHIGSGTGSPVAVGETDYVIDRVESNTSVRLTTQPPRGKLNAGWHVTTATENFFNADSINVYTGLLKDELAETPGYKLVIVSPASLAGEYDLDYDPANPAVLPEIGNYWLQTSDTLANGEGDEAQINHWYVVPQDDKTPFFAFEDSYGSKIDFLSFTDNAGDSNSIGSLINFDGKRDIGYLVIGGNQYQIAGVVREDRFNPSSAAYTLRITTRVDSLISPTFSWEIWRGLTTDTFIDTVNAPFASRAVGDVIRVDPGGPDEQDLVITEVVSDSEVKVAPEIDAGQSGLTYVLFNSVRPGMELVAGSRRVAIVDIDSEHVLRLERPLPMAAGSGLPWFVVLPGVDLNVSYIADRTPNFIANGGFGNTTDGLHDWVEGSEIHFTTPRTVKAQIVNGFDRDGDRIFETLLVTLRMDMARGPMTYRVLDTDERLTKEFGSVSQSLTPVEAGDVLTVWSQDGIFEVTAETSGELQVTPRLPSSLGGEHFVVVRGGTPSWGRYLLLKYLLDRVDLQDDLELLKLRLAEVAADFGGDQKVDVVVGPGDGFVAGGSFVEDGDEDGETPIIQVPKVTTVEPSDRVDLRIGGVEYHSYVLEVDNEDVGFTRLRLYREFNQAGSLTHYKIYKNSISYVISDVLERREEVQNLYDVSRYFSVPESDAVSRSRDLLNQLGLDRALDALDSGDLSSLVDMTESTASYAAVAEGAVNTAGNETAMAGTSTGTAASSSYAAGVNPATGERVPTSGGASGLTSSAVVVPEEVETRIALARVSEWIFADALTHRAAQLSLDDLRSRRIYELIGEVDSDLITDTDPTLPWIEVTGSRSSRLTEIEEEAVAALDYMIENPDEFEDVETE